MRKRYLIAAVPAVAVIAFGWIMPLVVYGHSALEMDGGGRVIGEDGICCSEPYPYYLARMAELASPLVLVASAAAMLAIRRFSKQP